MTPARDEVSALSFGALLRRCADISGVADPDVRWIDEQLLLDVGVAPWTELPLWVPSVWDAPGIFDLSVDRAVAAGLVGRPLDDTLRDLAAWATADPHRATADDGTRARSGVLTPEREAELLARWG